MAQTIKTRRRRQGTSALAFMSRGFNSGANETHKDTGLVQEPSKTKETDAAIDFLKSQGFQINPVDGIYRVRKAGWDKRPYEIDADTLIEQANLFRNMAEKARG